MDAKRIISIVQVRRGELLEGPGLALERARHLEMAGADELIFQEAEHPWPGQAQWLHDLAAALFIPFAVTCSGLGSTLEACLAAGADQVILRVGPGELPALARAASAFGRNRLMVALTVAPAPAGGFRVTLDDEEREALAWMAELGQMGAGAILLSTEAKGAALDPLWAGTAHLALPVLFASEDSVLGAGALQHGADGWAMGDGSLTPAQHKAALAGLGLALRH